MSYPSWLPNQRTLSDSQDPDPYINPVNGKSHPPYFGETKGWIISRSQFQTHLQPVTATEWEGAFLETKTALPSPPLLLTPISVPVTCRSLNKFACYLSDGILDLKQLSFPAQLRCSRDKSLNDKVYTKSL